MKIFMSPAIRRGTPDRFIDVTVSGLRAAGVEVRSLPYVPSSGRVATVHLHWPEMYFASGCIAQHGALNAARMQSILTTIRNVRRRGGRLVWTVHNLAPRRRLRDKAQAAYEGFHAEIVDELDVFVSLTHAGVPVIRRAFPRLADVPYVVARHPHYREVVPPGPPSRDRRAEWNFPAGSIVVGVLGQIQRYNDIGGVMRAFRGIPDPRLRLVIAGPCSDQSRVEILVQSSKDPRILFIEQGEMSDQALADYHAAVDMVIYNGARSFNSGTVIMALSLNRPLIAPAGPVNGEIADLVGPCWMTLFDPPLTSHDLEAAIERLWQQTRGDECPLEAFDPLLSCRRVVRAYAADRSGLDL